MYEFAVTPATTQIRRRGVKIAEVEPASLAAELELESGDRILRVNGRTVRDYLDFRFQTSGETEFVFEVIKKDGEEWEIELDREEGEDFGITFEQIVPRQCANECIFCFCKGNPETARPALFVRDEDVRLSFLYGNYTTLSSITEQEMTRVIEQSLSPQYVSVHATDLATRAYLLGVDEKRADINDKIQRLMNAGIQIHAQVVLCPTINDGQVLQSTISDLAALYPKVISCAIVPLALTKYNTDSRLTRVMPEWCAEVIKQVTPIQKRLRAKLGTTFAFLGDEIYLKANRPVPSRAHYGNYPQIEDGVGMVRSFHQDFARLIKRLTRRPPANPQKLNGTLLTGRLFYPYLHQAIGRLNTQFNTRLHTLAVPSLYFGRDVSVAGLMTGCDVIITKEKIRGDFVVMSKSAIKSDDSIMLDGMSISTLQDSLSLPCYTSSLSGLLSTFQER